MKPHLPSVICVSLLFGTAFVATASQARTISDVPSIPRRVLQRSISHGFYKSLLKSPLEGVVIVRGQLGTTARLNALRIVHSELEGKFDSVALERARKLTIAGYYSTDKLNGNANVLVNVLIYKIADGTAVLSFAQLDEPGGDQQQYYGCAVLEVLKNDGTWVHIPSVDSLEGKGMALRTFRNDSKLAMREIYFFAGFKTGSKP
jgi:hypothetical protein